MLSRLIERLLGWFFRPFNRFFKASSNSYQGAVSRTLGRRGVVFIVYVVLLAGTGLMFNAVPRGFIPTQDKLYLIAGVKLPEGSSLERTDAVLQRMKDIALGTDGVAHVIGLTGFNPTQQTNTPNYAVAFPILKPFNERHRSAKEIAADIQAEIANLKTRNDKGEMVPIGSIVKISQTYGPDPVLRYNGYPAADFIGEANPAMLSSAQAMGTMAELARRVLPNGMTIEWTDLSFQEATQGNAALLVFPVSVLLASLVLAALYESWVLPLAVILIVPMCMLSALAGVKLYGGDNNTFVQVGLVVLMGLACKNAILIVEFARELDFQGKGIVEAALKACRLRLRPIVMTSVAFIAGTIPLVLSQGAGAEVRSATGVTVFAGMIGVTLFGLFLTPVFYVGLRKLSGRKLYVTAQA